MSKFDDFIGVDSSLFEYNFDDLYEYKYGYWESYNVEQNKYCDFLPNKLSSTWGFMDTYDILNSNAWGHECSLIVEEELRKISKMAMKKIFQRKLNNLSFCEPFSILPTIFSKFLVRGSKKDELIESCFYHDSNEMIKIRDYFLKISLSNRIVKLYVTMDEGKTKLGYLKYKIKGKKDQIITKINNLYSVLKYLSRNTDTAFLGLGNGKQIEHSTGLRDLFTSCLNNVGYKVIEYEEEGSILFKPVLEVSNFISIYGVIAGGCLIDYFKDKMNESELTGFIMASKSPLGRSRLKNWQTKRNLVDFAYILEYFGKKRNFRISDLAPTLKVRAHLKNYERVKERSHFNYSRLELKSAEELDEQLIEDGERVERETAEVNRLLHLIEEDNKKENETFENIRERCKQSIDKIKETEGKLSRGQIKDLRSNKISLKKAKTNNCIAINENNSIKGQVFKRINEDFVKEVPEKRIPRNKMEKEAAKFPEFTPYKDAILKQRNKVVGAKSWDELDLSSFIFNWKTVKEELWNEHQENLYKVTNKSIIKGVIDNVSEMKAQTYKELKEANELSKKIKKKSYGASEAEKSRVSEWRLTCENKFQVLKTINEDNLEILNIRKEDNVKNPENIPSKVPDFLCDLNRIKKILNKELKREKADLNHSDYIKKDTIFKNLNNPKNPETPENCENKNENESGNEDKSENRMVVSVNNEIDGLKMEGVKEARGSLMKTKTKINIKVTGKPAQKRIEEQRKIKETKIGKIKDKTKREMMKLYHKIMNNSKKSGYNDYLKMTSKKKRIVTSEITKRLKYLSYIDYLKNGVEIKNCILDRNSKSEQNSIEEIIKNKMGIIDRMINEKLRENRS